MLNILYHLSKIAFIATCFMAIFSSNPVPERRSMSVEAIERLLEPDSLTKEVIKVERLLVAWGMGNRRGLAWPIVKASLEAGLDARYVAAVVWQESRGNPAALGLAGEVGLMQVHPYFWEGRYPECGPHLSDIATNLCYGTSILRYFLERDGHYWRALESYNGATKYANEVNNRVLGGTQ